MTHRLRDAGPAIGTVLALLALIAVSGCSEAHRVSAACRPTKGEPSSGAALPVAGEATGHARLHPGPDVTAEQAAAEAPARRGLRLIVAGTIYADDCRTPLPGAHVQVWQTDANGEYGPGHGTDDLKCCYLLASLRADSRGRYSITTIRPGHYRGADDPPPAHIHFNVYRGTRGVGTEVDFAGDPYLAKADDVTEVIHLKRSSGRSGPVLRGRFNVVLARTG